HNFNNEIIKKPEKILSLISSEHFITPQCYVCQEKMKLETDFSKDKFCSNCNKNIKFNGNDSKYYYVCINSKCNALRGNVYSSQGSEASIVICTNCTKQDEN